MGWNKLLQLWVIFIHARGDRPPPTKSRTVQILALDYSSVSNPITQQSFIEDSSVSSGRDLMISNNQVGVGLLAQIDHQTPALILAKQSGKMSPGHDKGTILLTLQTSGSIEPQEEKIEIELNSGNQPEFSLPSSTTKKSCFEGNEFRLTSHFTSYGWTITVSQAKVERSFDKPADVSITGVIPEGNFFKLSIVEGTIVQFAYTHTFVYAETFKLFGGAATTLPKVYLMDANGTIDIGTIYNHLNGQTASGHFFTVEVDVEFLGFKISKVDT